MPDGPNPGQSYEAWIESKAGACPPDAGAELRAAFDQVQGHMEPVLAAQLSAMIDRDWPMPPIPEWSEEESDDPGTQ